MRDDSRIGCSLPDGDAKPMKHRGKRRPYFSRVDELKHGEDTKNALKQPGLVLKWALRKEDYLKDENQCVALR